MSMASPGADRERGVADREAQEAEADRNQSAAELEDLPAWVPQLCSALLGGSGV